VHVLTECLGFAYNHMNRTIELYCGWGEFGVCPCFIFIELQMALYSTNTISNSSTRYVHSVESAGVWFIVRSVIQNGILWIWCLFNGNIL